MDDHWRIGVAAAVVKDEKLLLVKHTYGDKKGLWALPGGYAKYGERLDEAATREVYEETRLETEVLDVIGIVSRYCAAESCVFVVFRLASGSLEVHPDGDEVEEFRWAGMQDIERMSEDELWYDIRNPALAALGECDGLGEDLEYIGASEKSKAYSLFALHRRGGKATEMIVIEPIQAAHVEGFHRALDSVCRERKYLARYQAPELESTRRFVMDNIRNGEPQYVAVNGQIVVGWCDISLSDKPVFKHCGTLGMGVVAEYRGRGIGTRLLDAVLARAKEIGLDKVELAVYETNETAIHLYEKFGFVREGRKVKGSKVDGLYQDDILMARFLDDYQPNHKQDE